MQETPCGGCSCDGGLLHGAVHVERRRDHAVEPVFAAVSSAAPAAAQSIRMSCRQSAASDGVIASVADERHRHAAIRRSGARNFVSTSTCAAICDGPGWHPAPWRKPSEIRSTSVQPELEILNALPEIFGASKAATMAGDHIIDKCQVAASIAGTTQGRRCAGLQQASQPRRPLRAAGSEHAGRTQDDGVAAIIDIFLNDTLTFDLCLPIAADRSTGRLIFAYRSGRGAINRHAAEMDDPARAVTPGRVAQALRVDCTIARSLPAMQLTTQSTSRTSLTKLSGSVASTANAERRDAAPGDRSASFDRQRRHASQ